MISIQSVTRKIQSSNNETGPRWDEASQARRSPPVISQPAAGVITPTATGVTQSYANMQGCCSTSLQQRLGLISFYGALAAAIGLIAWALFHLGQELNRSRVPTNSNLTPASNAGLVGWEDSILSANGEPTATSPQDDLTESKRVKFQSSPQFTIAELFTSEGCSSCPPADRLLSKTLREQQESTLPLIAISYHVDYWNYLGWEDRFSTNSLTTRQTQYAKALKQRSNYTPQLIIDGRDGFVGSDASQVRRALKASQLRNQTTIASDNDLQRQPILAGEALWDAAQQEVRLSVNLGVGNLQANTPYQLWAVITEDHLSSDVDAGENAGARLSHDRVVRAIQSIDWNSEKTQAQQINLKLPQDIQQSHARLVVFLQDSATMKFASAVELSFGEK